MKLIALVPVRNEARILATTLTCLDQFCDHIIVSDHQSTDSSREIAKSFSRVTLIHNKSHIRAGAEHGRPAMFNAARQFEGNNLLLCLDADEIAPPFIFSALKSAIEGHYAPGTYFSLWWVQLWRSINHYRNDTSVWSNNYAPMLLYDDRSDHIWGDRHFLHGGRLPNRQDSSKLVQLNNFPVLHLQWVYWERTQYKQAHYRMLELVKSNFRNAMRINAAYEFTLGQDNAGVTPVPETWLKGVTFPTDLMVPKPCWHYDDIFSMFDTYGIVNFESLQIWHLPDLRQRFLIECGRTPKPLVRSTIRRLLKTTALQTAKAVLAPSFLERLARKRV